MEKQLKTPKFIYRYREYEFMGEMYGTINVYDRENRKKLIRTIVDAGMSFEDLKRFASEFENDSEKWERFDSIVF